MPLFDHLGELRRRVVIIAVSLIAAACVLYMVAPQLVEFLKDPIREYLPDGGSTYVLSPLGGFSIQFRVAFFAAAIVTSPITIWQILAFFLPALKPNERKWVVPTFAVGAVLFIIGTIFCYFIILDPAFDWMIAQTNAVATVLPDTEAYIKLIILFELGFGIAFELPLIVFYLIVFNVVPYKVLRSSWRTVYIVLMVISAMVTPDASPVTMGLMFAAMITLYEASLLVSRIVLRKKIDAQKKRAEEED